MAEEMCDLPGQGDRETGFHHFMADGETAGMNKQGIGEAGVRSSVKKGGKMANTTPTHEWKTLPPRRCLPGMGRWFSGRLLLALEGSYARRSLRLDP